MYRIAFGGATRKESVYNAISNMDSGYVIIHDGARHLIKKEYIDTCISSMEDYFGATIAVKSHDTVKIGNS